MLKGFLVGKDADVPCLRSKPGRVAGADHQVPVFVRQRLAQKGAGLLVAFGKVGVLVRSHQRRRQHGKGKAKQPAAGQHHLPQPGPPGEQHKPRHDGPHGQDAQNGGEQFGPAAGVIDHILEGCGAANRLPCAGSVDAGHRGTFIAAHPDAQQMVEVPPVPGGIPQAQRGGRMGEIVGFLLILLAGGGVGLIENEIGKGIVLDGNAVKGPLRQHGAGTVQKLGKECSGAERPVVGGQIEAHPVNPLPRFDGNRLVKAGGGIGPRLRPGNGDGAAVLVIDDLIDRLAVHPLGEVKPRPGRCEDRSRRHKKGEEQLPVPGKKRFDGLHRSPPFQNASGSKVLYMKRRKSATGKESRQRNLRRRTQRIPPGKFPSGRDGVGWIRRSGPSGS